MKRFLALLLLLPLALSGCSCSADPEEKQKDSEPGYVGHGDYPNELEITTPYFFHESGERASGVPERREWCEEMSRRFGTEISVSVPGPEVYNNIIKQALAQEVTGIVDIGSYDMLLMAISNGAILPLEKYLKKNEAWNTLPESFRKLYEIDGHIWAIPSGLSYTMGVRSIRTDWLATLGLEQPSTLSGFMDYAEKMAASTGIFASSAIPAETAEGIAVGNNHDLSWALDILRLYGVYIDSSGKLPFAYDPVNKCYTDGVLSPNAAAAFEYLRKLYVDGCLDEFGMYRTAANFKERVRFGYYGSFYDSLGSGKYGDGMYAAAEELYAKTAEWPTTVEYWDVLTNLYSDIVLSADDGTVNPQVVIPESTPYVLINGTNQPKESINLFADMLFGSYGNYLLSRVGLPENYVLNADGTINLKMILDEEASDKAGEAVYYSRHMPRLIGKIDGWRGSENLQIYTTDNEIINEHHRERDEYLAGFMEKAENMGQIIKAPMDYAFPRSDFLLSNLSDIAVIFNDFMTEVITNTDKDVQTVISEYITKMELLGAQQVLDEANAAIGKTSGMRY